MALLDEGRGDISGALRWLDEAERRCTRLSDPYVWLQAAILDTRCRFGRRHGLPELATWAHDLYQISARSGMRAFLDNARAALHPSTA
jgi:hypothetical protein